MTAAELILDRAILICRAGQPNPMVALIDGWSQLAGKSGTDVEPGAYAKAVIAAMDAAGGSLVRWYEYSLPRRTAQESVALLEEALFAMQVGG